MAGASLADQPNENAETPADDRRPVRAHDLITTADDFVVNFDHNGVSVPDTKRHLLEEGFGETVERIDDAAFCKADWIVYHVVNNRLRRGGASYFGRAACYATDEFGFVSDPVSGAWSACDGGREVDRFIARRDHLRHQAASPIANPWADGTPLMKQHAGQVWDGAPDWWASRSTWLKVLVD